MKYMSGSKLKCDCGQAISDGSVFCHSCKGKVLKRNAKRIKQEEKRYQIKVKGKGRKSKGKKK